MFIIQSKHISHETHISGWCRVHYMHRRMHTYIHTCIHVYMLTYVHTYMHACMHVYMLTYVHTYMHTPAYTHVPRLNAVLKLRSCRLAPFEKVKNEMHL